MNSRRCSETVWRAGSTTRRYREKCSLNEADIQASSGDCREYTSNCRELPINERRKSERGTGEQEGGTLFQLRNLINRRNVLKDVRNDMNATDFFETVAVGLIIPATLQFFGMQGISDNPHNQSLQDAVELPHAEKWLVLSTCIGDLLRKFVSSSLACPHHEDFSFDTSEYACTVLPMALFVLEFDDAVNEGDGKGKRVYRIWQYLLHFRASGRIKYTLEALNLHLQYHGLPPNIAFQLMWSRFVNSKGEKGKNVACDFHMEHMTRSLKMSMCGLGANITENSMSRAAKCLQTGLNICDNFDHVTDIPYASGKHSLVSVADDAKLIVKELHERSKEIPGKMHPSFPNSKRNHFGTTDWNTFESWFENKKISLRYTLWMKKLFMAIMYDM